MSEELDSAMNSANTLMTMCAGLLADRDRLEAANADLLDLLKDLVDLEGPQPGNSAWAVRVNAAIAKAVQS